MEPQSSHNMAPISSKELLALRLLRTIMFDETIKYKAQGWTYSVSSVSQFNVLQEPLGTCVYNKVETFVRDPVLNVSIDI